MSERNKAILAQANAAIMAGDHEGFLAHCADDTVWTWVGDKTLEGKEAVRRWMAETYTEPPRFNVTQMIAEGDFVAAIGDITARDENGTMARYSYCDVWRFRGDRLLELKAFVVKADAAGS